ncbi:MAG: GIY-YIG nuclease family protein [Roseburia sp.]|nr:GIY-YIG nuclease family protein [Anaeroplasma bactoclasticum]MCM1196811.1 GIY-YIG nuclease family protein [Roseburia sp.]MCM1556947.1 GIY-YIG nuclease family protein [Anaeroplasma bactoclasticum]
MINLNDILHLTNEEIENSKIELNMHAGNGGESFLERWLLTPETNRVEGKTECSYWGWYGKRRNFYPGNFVFSFVKLNYDEWLFVSAAKIIDIPNNSRATYEILTKYQPLFGRMIVKHNKGNTYARYVFRMKERISEVTVKEILSKPYSGDHFPGYHKVCLSYAQLESIIRIRPQDWIGALENQKAVYVITDTSNGKLYVGSATSNDKMLLARWQNYVNNGHGGNVELKKLDFNHIKQYFQYSIIENYNANIDDSYVLEREQYWKKVLKTNQGIGYNKN